MTLDSNDKKKVLDFIKYFRKTDFKKKVEIFRFAEKHGIHITPEGFYSPIPSITKLDAKNFYPKDEIHFDWNESLQIELLNKFGEYSKEFQSLVSDGSFQYENGSFATHDAPIYYAMIRHFKPRKIIEIGAGYSTKVASLAASKNQDTSIIAIDPYLSVIQRLKLPKSVEFLKKDVREIPLNLFEQLSKNDILFIDSSHVSKAGSDVNFLYLDVLPILKRGVLVHIHDIFLPNNNYPRRWIEDLMIFWNEQYLLHAFLLCNENFEVIFGNAFMGMKHPDLLNKFFESKVKPGGGSFWIRRKSD